MIVSYLVGYTLKQIELYLLGTGTYNSVLLSCGILSALLIVQVVVEQHYF
jgi:hypothetical protein